MLESRPWDPLSPREKEILFLLVDGKRAKDIADLLEISPKTVDTYRASLMRKLNFHDLAGLIKSTDPEGNGGGGTDEGDSPLVPKPRGPRPTLGPLSARAKREVEQS
jgi:DNA-binding CsgD family transcriptional regulator